MKPPATRAELVEVMAAARWAKDLERYTGGMGRSWSDLSQETRRIRLEREEAVLAAIEAHGCVVISADDLHEAIEAADVEDRRACYETWQSEERMDLIRRLRDSPYRRKEQVG